MNVDISPDGRWLAFDMLGDIYRMPAGGGAATSVTTGSAWDSRPVWSPDGRSIAFISDRAGDDQVYVVNTHDLTAEAERVSFQSPGLPSRKAIEGNIIAVEWLPDSRHLVADGRVIAIDGNVSEQADGLRQDGFGFYGSKKSLTYFVAKDTAYATPSTTDEFSVESEAWEFGRNNISQRVAAMDGKYSPGWDAPAVSANGRWVVTKSRSRIGGLVGKADGYMPNAFETHLDTIRVRDNHTGEERVLVKPGSSPGWRSNGTNASRIGFSANTRFAISPDSKSTFVAYGGSIHRIDLATGKDFPLLMKVDFKQCMPSIARPETLIEGDHVPVKAMRYIQRNPYDHSLVFSAIRKLYTAEPSGMRVHQLYPQREGQFEPAYSPDGAWIAYVTWDEARGGHVWRVRSDGSAAERLTTVPGYYLSPTWSPDGRKIAFSGSWDIHAERSGFDSNFYGGDLFLVELDHGGANKISLSTQVRLGAKVGFSGDGDRLYFFEYGGKVGSRFRFSSVSLLDGSERNEGLDDFFKSSRVASASVDPSGANVAAVKNGNLFLISCRSTERGRLTFNATTCAETEITSTGGGDPSWREDGRVLEWSFSNKLYRMEVSNRFEFGDSTSQVRQESIGDIDTTEISMLVPRSRARSTLALVGAKIITMRGYEVIENGTLIISDGLIERVGNSSDVPIPAEASVIQMAGRTIMPGLVDAHAHLNELPRDLLVRNHWEALIDLAFGVTTVKNPSNGGDHAFAYAELIAIGDMVGPRMLSTTGLIRERVSIDSDEQANSVALRYKQLGATFLKYHTGFNRAQRRWLMNGAKRQQLGVAAHLPVINYTTGRLDLSTIVDGATTSEHEISSSSDQFDDVTQFLAQSGVGVCFAPLNGTGGYPANYWDSLSQDERIRSFYRGDVPAESTWFESNNQDDLLALRPEALSNSRFLAKLVDAGGKVMVGSHGDHDGVGMHLEMWAHARGGMRSHDVLRASTIVPAEGLGAEKIIGSIEMGKIADVIVLRDDPLQDIRNTLSVDLVIKSGIVREAATLRQIWPQDQLLPAWQMGQEERNSSKD